jgi:DNA polymerase-4
VLSFESQDFSFERRIPRGEEVRHIIHADLDAFYSSVEQLDNPEMRGKPVMVGGSPRSRGVVAAASYEARKYGIHSAMPMATAVRHCPQGIVVRPRFDRYHEVSDQVMDIFHELTDLVEPLSLDEAYLDVTCVVAAGQSPRDVARDLKRRVKKEVGLALSVGASTCKSISKIASELKKPDGLVVVLPGQEREFLHPLPVGKLVGIGPKSAELLRQEDIDTVGRLAAQPLDWFLRRFGKRAMCIWARAQGEDREPVYTERPTKSVSAEGTFPNDLSDPDELYQEMAHFAHRVARHLEDKELQGKTVWVKIRLADYTTFTRQATLPMLTRSEDTILQTAWRLLSAELAPGRAFRLLGVGVSSFSEVEQLALALPLAIS